MSLRVGQCRARGCGDDLRVDEGLGAVTSRNHDGAAGWLEEGLAEVLHEPRRSQDCVGKARPGEQVESDAAHGRLGWRRVDAVGAEISDVRDAGGLGLVEEHRHLVNEVRPHERSDEVDPLDATERRSVGPGVVPIEMCIGTRAGRSADRQATREQPARNA
jgi:hypothetical protein